MNKYQLGWISVGSLIGILLLFIINDLTTPDYLWFLYPAFFLILWPLSLYFIMKKKYKLYAYFCTTLLILYMLIENILNSPEHPWILYAAYPLIWWPITVSLGKQSKTLTYAWIVSITTILYYAILNLFLSPVHPWVIYPTYVILWWPLILYYARQKNYFGLSIVGSLFTILFFSTMNLVTTPHTLWAIYPIFIILWWPLSVYYFHVLKQKQKEHEEKKST